jgi:hypothetical protein
MMLHPCCPGASAFLLVELLLVLPIGSVARFGDRQGQPVNLIDAVDVLKPPKISAPTTTTMYVVSLQGVAGAGHQNDGRLDSFHSDWRRRCGEQVEFKRCAGQLDATVLNASREKRRHWGGDVKAIVGYGVTKAFVACIDLALADNQETSVFLEDDARLSVPAFCNASFRSSLWDAAPSDTFLLMLGGWQWSPPLDPASAIKAKNDNYTGTFSRLEDSYGAYGFAVPRANLWALQQGWNDDLSSGFASGRQQLSPDLAWYQHAAASNKSIYNTSPLIINHPKGWSNTWNKTQRAIP